jgi:signal transduction histidine kinase
VSPLELPEEERRRLRHDFRTPLTVVTGFAEVLTAEKPIADEARRDYARRIHDAAGEIRALLDELLGT